MMFGHFTGNKRLLQALSVDEGKLCNVGGSCRTVQGLELLSKAEGVAVAGRTNKRVDRAALLGLTEFTQTACLAFYESDTRVGFTCEQEVIPSAGPTLEAFTVHGAAGAALDLLMYAGRAPVNAAARRTPTAAETEAHKRAPIAARDLIERAFANAGGPMTLKNFKAGLYTADDEFGAGFVKVARYYNDDEEGNGFMGPAAYEGYFNGLSRGLRFSDSYGIYFNFLTGQALTECLQACDLNKSSGDSWCDVASVAAFASIAVPVVVTAIAIAWSGAGAGTVLIAGVTGAQLVSGSASLLCKGFTANSRILCAAECHARP